MITGLFIHIIIFSQVFFMETHSVEEAFEIGKRLGLLLPPECGRHEEIHRRVIGGSIAKRGAWPWIAILGNLLKSSGEIDFFCGGSLISKQYIVSAAHCFRDLKLWVFARMGEININNNESTSFDFPIEKIYIHPNYKKLLNKHDVAVLKLNKEVAFTEKIHPLCLPITNNVLHADFTDEYAFVAGWGAVAYGESMSNELREVRLKVYANHLCEKAFQHVDNIDFDSNSICAGDKHVNSCQGDSGGPLMYTDGSIYYLIGIVSSGIECGSTGRPANFMRVTSYIDFILANMNESL